MRMLARTAKIIREYSGKIHRAAIRGYCGEHPAKSCRGKLGIAGGCLSSIVLALVTIMPYLPVRFSWCAVFFIYLFFLLIGCSFYRLPGRRRCGSRSGAGNLLWSAAIITLLLSGFFYLILRLYGLESSPDTLWQWAQVQSGKFDDWHPVAHTFTLYLLSRICNSSFFVAFVLCVFFSVYCGWFYYTLRKYDFSNLAAIPVIVFIAASPVTITALTVLWKDSAFMITALGVGVAMINLWYSKGEWLKKWYNQAILALLLVYLAFVRHNGIFFTVPMVVFLPLIAEDKSLRRKLLIFSGIVLLLCGSYMVGRKVMIKHDIITQSGQEQSFHEAVGLPMSMMANAYVNAPEKLDPEVCAFLSARLPYEKWKEYYKGDFNSVKFNAGVNVLEDITPKEFFHYFCLSLKSAPGECMQGFLSVTSVAWSPFWNHAWLWKLIIHRRYVERAGWIFAASGLYCLLLIIFTLYLLPQRGLKVLFISMPFLAYNYGTALLLTGWDQRFFWGVIIGSVPVLMIMFDECRASKGSGSLPDAKDGDLPQKSPASDR